MQISCAFPFPLTSCVYQSYKHTLCCVSTSNKRPTDFTRVPPFCPCDTGSGDQTPDQLMLLCVCSEGWDVASTKCNVYQAEWLMTSPSECFMDTNISWRRFTWTRFSRSKYRTTLQFSSVDDKKTSSFLVWKVLHFSALLLFLPEDCFSVVFFTYLIQCSFWV